MAKLRKLLGILFAWEMFLQYIGGRTVHVETEL